ncbi:hypothetical protein B0I35DRAFT_481564 [Stachybotrys elegans]|uniref:Uncharacterized protein n=1 Tax=Stachybotrys elegans TaxID=80388 RepID=A0A8K0SGL9_9HYPO|nr:hypothetical protein B0I35DRAFT_481564 [Stachybotrys elegans]
MAITSAVGDIFNAFYELIASVFGAVYSVIHAAVSIVVGFFTGLFNLVFDVLQGAFHAVGSSAKLVLHNVDKFIWVGIGVTLAVVVARLSTQGRQVKSKA